MNNIECGFKRFFFVLSVILGIYASGISHVHADSWENLQRSFWGGFICSLVSFSLLYIFYLTIQWIVKGFKKST